MTSDSSTSAFRPIPDKPSVDGLESFWVDKWDADKVYSFDRTQPRENVFSIDTPPPTVSGSLHVGHIFSYTHTDCVARYQRMTGKAVFYPIGWDDNGLPTERRVQNYFGVRCDPKIPYDPDFTPPEKPNAKKQVSISRRNFVELCHKLTEEDEKVYEDLWRRVGLSYDWSTMYSTISQDSQRASQLAFVRNLARGEAYSQEAPGLWDVTFQTAVAQAELEAREYPGHFHKIQFHGESGPVVIETTRPELLAACVALIAHPDDERYQPLFGKTVKSPLFEVEVPVVAHEAAQPDKGAGIAMCCTFGDLTDVQWWRELQLPTRSIIGRDGRTLRETPAWLTDGQAAAGAADLYQSFAGKTVFSSREVMVQALRESGDLLGEPQATQRMANFFEKGDKPLEIVTSRQWYLRNGGRDEDLRATLRKQGESVQVVPHFMSHRLTNWIDGLNGDWLVSRQRYFGVPFPIWYPVDAEGNPDYDNPIVAAEDTLPVDPSSHIPPGFSEDQRDVPGGFTADPDVMDTWATSSLTPQIACGWERDQDLFERTFPMDMTAHAHEIIRTWMFSRIVRAQAEHGCAPWKTAAISGFVVDPDRKKMSKSKNNVVVPDEILGKFGTDAVRWRAAMARPGVDSPFDEQQMKVGRRLAIKVLNASKFVLGLSSPQVAHDATLAEVTEPVDLAMLKLVQSTIVTATKAFDAFEYTEALEDAEKTFWTFCDDYIELVKERAYSDAATAQSAKSAAALALNALTRMLAPFMPYVTDEVWSWWQHGSIHNSAWPTTAEWSLPADADAEVLAQVSEALGLIRGAKSEAKVSQRTGVKSVTFGLSESAQSRIQQAEEDLRAAGSIAELTYSAAEELAISAIDLAEPEPKKK